MKNKFDLFLREKRDELKLDGSKNGLRLNWVNENNWCLFYQGVQYTPIDFSQPKEFVNNVLEGTVDPNEVRMAKLIKKQAADMVKKESKKEELKEADAEDNAETEKSVKELKKTKKTVDKVMGNSRKGKKKK